MPRIVASRYGQAKKTPVAKKTEIADMTVDISVINGTIRNESSSMRVSTPKKTFDTSKVNCCLQRSLIVIV